jgi:uncharacterized membrane protein
MREEKETADRLAAYSDAVFAVIVTIMVLELKAPDQTSFSDLWPLWPTAISYAVSYLFIAIIWINHHYLWRFVGSPTLRLIWINFIHLFTVSLLPFATAWVARTRLASSPMVFYAGLFVCIDVAYNFFEREVLTRTDSTQVKRAHAAHGAAPIHHCSCELYGGYAGGIRCATRGLCSDMRRSDPPFAARGRAWQPHVMTGGGPAGVLLPEPSLPQFVNRERPWALDRE